MKHPAVELDDGVIAVAFDRRLTLEFHGARITSDAGLLAYRGLDAALGVTDLAGTALTECRHGKDTRHLLTGLLRQSVCARVNWLRREVAGARMRVPRIDGHGIRDGKTTERDRRGTWTQ